MTHCDRLLAVLADGQPHDHLSLYRLGMIVHSRVSELRKRGHRIDMWRDGDLYLYQLHGLTEGEEYRESQSRAAPRTDASPSVSPSQLTLTEAA